MLFEEISTNSWQIFTEIQTSTDPEIHRFIHDMMG